MRVSTHDDPDAVRPGTPVPVPGNDLDRATCLELLRSSRLGRVGLSVDALPVIVPVGFEVVGDHIVLGAHVDPRELAAIDGVVVAFEADAWDPERGEGWSVLVQGPARRLVDRADLGPLPDRGSPAWLTEDTEVVVVTTDVIHGVRLVAGRAPRHASHATSHARV